MQILIIFASTNPKKNTNMKHIILLILIIGMTLIGCNQKSQEGNLSKNQLKNIETFDKSDDDKDDIQNLIRNVLNWADSKDNIELLPIASDSANIIYTSFDLEKHKQNLDILKSTDFFTTEFIDNYNQIILAINKGLLNGEYERWLVGDLPTFPFANGASPWCMCQDNLDWNTVEVKAIALDDDEGELEWYWGNISADTDPSWKEFRYKFNVKKENNIWQISYMEGFDFEESTRKDNGVIE